MRFDVLHVPDCPHVPVLLERIRTVDPFADVTTVVVASEHEAVSLGMRGSPTLLLNGCHPGDVGPEHGSLSCVVHVPSVDQIARWVAASH